MQFDHFVVKEADPFLVLSRPEIVAHRSTVMVSTIGAKVRYGLFPDRVGLQFLLLRDVI